MYTKVVNVSFEDSELFYWNCNSTSLISLFNFSNERWFPDSHWLGVF